MKEGVLEPLWLPVNPVLPSAELSSANSTDWRFSQVPTPNPLQPKDSIRNPRQTPSIQFDSGIRGGQQDPEKKGGGRPEVFRRLGDDVRKELHLDPSLG